MSTPERPPVRSKAAFYGRHARGEFGNRCRNWGSLDELRASDFRGRVVFRERRPGGVCLYGVTYAEAAAAAAAFVAGTYNLNEAMPDADLTLQGEVFRDVGGLRLFASEARLPMRPALRESGREWRGLLALLTLRRHLDPASLDDVQDLLDLYPDHVVEFGAYRVPVGDCPGRNTVIWEVRAY